MSTIVVERLAAFRTEMFMQLRRFLHQGAVVSFLFEQESEPLWQAAVAKTRRIAIRYARRLPPMVTPRQRPNRSGDGWKDDAQQDAFWLILKNRRSIQKAAMKSVFQWIAATFPKIKTLLNETHLTQMIRRIDNVDFNFKVLQSTAAFLNRTEGSVIRLRNIRKVFFHRATRAAQLGGELPGDSQMRREAGVARSTYSDAMKALRQIGDKECQRLFQPASS